MPVRAADHVVDRVFQRARASWQVLAVVLAATDPLVIAVGLSLSALVLAALLVLPRASFQTVFLHDHFIFADLAYRLASGQVQHLDFHSPLGSLMAVLPYLGYRVAGSFGAALPTALALLLLAITPMAVYVLATRFRWYLALPVGLYVLLLIASPLVAGDIPSRVTMGMWYNRVCWAVYVLLLLLYIPPYARTHRTAIVDGATAALFVALLFYTKITYGLFALAFLGLWLVLDRRALWSVGIAAALTAVIGILIELIWPIHRAYLLDILFALNSSPGVVSGVLQPIKQALRYSTETSIAVLAAAFLLVLRPVPWRDAVFFLFVLGCATLIVVQNSSDKSLACLAVIPLVAAERLARAEARTGSQGAAVGRWAALALLLVFLAEPLVYRGVALGYHTLHAAGASGNASLPSRVQAFHVAAEKGYIIAPGDAQALAAFAREGLNTRNLLVLLEEHTQTTPLTSGEYLFTLGKAVEVLQGKDMRNQQLFVFDIVNPFSFMLGTTPINGDLFCYHINRQYSRSNFIPAETLLGSVSVALVPRFPMEQEDLDALMDLYGDYLNRNFRPTRQNEYWQIWERTEPQTARPESHDRARRQHAGHHSPAASNKRPAADPSA